MGHISTAAAQHYYRQKSAKVAPLTSSNSQPYVEVTGAQLPITPISSGQPLYNYPYGCTGTYRKEYLASNQVGGSSSLSGRANTTRHLNFA